MVVVADTSPLNYLVAIGKIDILQVIYQRVNVPEQVVAELRSSEAPKAVQRWAAALPGWIDVHKVAESPSNPKWRTLHLGERAALELASRFSADLILIDERAGARLP